MFLLALACAQTTANSSPGPAPGPAPAPGTAPAFGSDAPEVVAYWNGGKLPYRELQADLDLEMKKMANDYLMGVYEAQSQAIDQKVNEQVLELEVKAAGLAAVDDLLTKEVKARVADPTDAEIEETYKALQRKLRGKPLEEVRDDVAKYARQRKEAERFQAYVTELRAKYAVAVQLPFPDLPRFPASPDDDPGLGPADAPVTIIQFADYQCPYCGTAQVTVDEVMKAYEGKIRFVFRDFPLNFHENATPAAVAANCAARQEKFWPIHDAIMKQQRAITDGDLRKLAADNGLDIGRWDECRKDPAMAAEVQADEQDGAKLGVTGTPAFFVNGVFLNGAQPFEKFKQIIDRELAVKEG
jgi:protein-disulfide isomerase